MSKDFKRTENVLFSSLSSRDTVLKERRHLLAKMSMRRDLVRALVAPKGYGKTALAVQYASTMHGADHAVILDCGSDTFCDSLVSGLVERAFHALPYSVHAVIFDDVPRLDSVQLDAFRSLTASLICGGIEVITTSLNSVRFDELSHSNSLIIDPVDLLVEGAEKLAAHRVAAIVWGDESSVERFALDIASSDFTPEELFAQILCFLMTDGPINQLEVLCSDRAHFEATCSSLSRFPHCGYDSSAGTFKTLSLDFDVACRILKSRMDMLVELSAFDTARDFIIAVCNLVMGRGFARRAAELASRLLDGKAALEWLRLQQDVCLRAGVHKPLEYLYACNVDSAKRIDRELLEASMIRCACLGYKRIAQRRFDELVLLGEGPSLDRSVLVRAWLALPERRKMIEGVYATTDDGKRNDERKGSTDDLPTVVCRSVPDRILFDLVRRYASDVPRFLEAGLEQCVLQDSLTVQGSILASALYMASQRTDESVIDECRKIIGVQGCVIRSVLDRFRYDSDNVSFDEALIVHFTSQLIDGDGFDAVVTVESRSRYRRFVADALRYEQSPLFRDDFDDSVSFDEQPDDHGSAGGQDACDSHPSLCVSVMGSFAISIDDTPIDRALMSRKKVNALLALMLLSHGTMIPKERLYSQLWPNIDSKKQKASFNNALSHLNKMLSVGNGKSSFVRSEHGACMIADTHLRCDLDEVNDLARSLMSLENGSGEVASSFTKLKTLAEGGFMPADNTNDCIDVARKTIRRRVLNSVIHAAQLLASESRYLQALEMLQYVCEKDPVREEVYRAIMYCQVRLGQRSEAVDTYFACREQLGEILGIDPSAETQELYRKILDGNDDEAML